MIPQVIRPREWQTATGFLGVIASQDRDARSSLHSRASGYSFPFAMLWKMLQCPTLEHEDHCECEHRLDARTARWRAHILKWSAAAIPAAVSSSVRLTRQTARLYAPGEGSEPRHEFRNSVAPMQFSRALTCSGSAPSDLPFASQVFA